MLREFKEATHKAFVWNEVPTRHRVRVCGFRSRDRRLTPFLVVHSLRYPPIRTRWRTTCRPSRSACRRWPYSSSSAACSSAEFPLSAAPSPSPCQVPHASILPPPPGAPLLTSCVCISLPLLSTARAVHTVHKRGLREYELVSVWFVIIDRYGSHLTLWLKRNRLSSLLTPPRCVAPCTGAAAAGRASSSSSPRARRTPRSRCARRCWPTARSRSPTSCGCSAPSAGDTRSTHRATSKPRPRRSPPPPPSSCS